MNETKWEHSLSEWIGEFEQLDTTDRRQVLRDVAIAHGELLQWLLEAPTTTVLQSTQKQTRFCIATDGTCQDLRSS